MTALEYLHLYQGSTSLVLSTEWPYLQSDLAIPGRAVPDTHGLPNVMLATRLSC